MGCLQVAGESHLPGDRPAGAGPLRRPLQEIGHAYVCLDSINLKSTLGRALQVCSTAVVVAMGVTPMVAGGCSVSMWVTAKARDSGAISSAAQKARPPPHPRSVASRGCGLWCATPMRESPTLSAANGRAASWSPTCSHCHKPAAVRAQGPPGDGHRRVAQGICPGERH
jgi:hypothetical protein